MDSSNTVLALLQRPNSLADLNMTVIIPANFDSNASGSNGQKSRLLTSPAEVCNQIWAYCVNIGEDKELVIAGSKILLYKRDEHGVWLHPPTTFFPAFLRTNKQICSECRAMLYSSNQVSLVVNEGSFLGRNRGLPVSPCKDHISIAAVPSQWNLALRESVHQIGAIRIYVILGFEHDNGKPLTSPADLAKKQEIAAIVDGALEDLCGILYLSKNLISVEVVYADIGRADLRTGREVHVLTPLSSLRAIKHVKVEGLPEDWTEYLEEAMRMGKSETTEELRNQALSRVI